MHSRSRLRRAGSVAGSASGPPLPPTSRVRPPAEASKNVTISTYSEGAPGHRKRCYFHLFRPILNPFGGGHFRKASPQKLSFSTVFEMAQNVTGVAVLGVPLLSQMEVLILGCPSAFKVTKRYLSAADHRLHEIYEHKTTPQES